VIPYLRSEVIAVVLAVWIVLRLVTRRPVIHLWPTALLVLGIATLMADWCVTHFPLPPPLLRGFETGLLLYAVLLFAEGSRRVAGLAKTPLRGALTATLIAFAAGYAFALLPRGREVVALGVIAAAVALYGTVPLLRMRRRRIGSALMVLAVIAFAAGRSAVLSAYVAGAPWQPTQMVAGVIALLLYGLALVTYALESARVPVGSPSGIA